MMTLIVMVFLLLSGAIAQTLLPPIAALGGGKAPLLMCVVMYYALVRSQGLTVAAALAAGLLQDALSPMPLGCSAFCFCAIGLLIHRFREVIFSESVLAAACLGGAGGAVVTVVTYLVIGYGSDGGAEYPLWRLVIRIMGMGALGMIAAPLVLGISGHLERWVGSVRAKEA